MMEHTLTWCRTCDKAVGPRCKCPGPVTTYVDDCGNCRTMQVGGGQGQGEWWKKPAPEPETLVVTRELLYSLTDDQECSFDHNGGCQAHGYLGLEQGQICPQEEAKRLLAGGKR